MSTTMKVSSFLSWIWCFKMATQIMLFQKFDYLHIMFLFYILIPLNFTTLNPILLHVKYIQTQTHNVGHWFILSNGVHELYCLLVVFIYIHLIVPWFGLCILLFWLFLVYQNMKFEEVIVHGVYFRFKASWIIEKCDRPFPSQIIANFVCSYVR
jgi:hypothetical protein